MNQDNIAYWCYGQPVYKKPGLEEWRHRREEEECEKCAGDINIRTSVNICQNGEANGGDANGGNGGDAAGGSAAAASADSEGEGDASAAASVGVNTRSKSYEDSAGAAQPLISEAEAQALTPEEAEDPNAVVIGEGASAIGGDAAGGAGGAGGVGGNASVSNSAAVTVENYVIVCCDKNGNPPSLALGTNNRKLDIKVDENGDTFVNGQKMDETELEDGTKVFIFRHNESKK